MSSTAPIPAAATKHFQWPEFDPIEGAHHVSDFPDFIVRAVASGNMRVKDDLAHVRGPDGDVTVHPGDWIICAPDGCLFACSDELHRTLVAVPIPAPAAHPEPANPDNAAVEGADTPDEPAPDEGADAEGGVPEFGPPFSSAVLARSARAREAQAKYDAAMAQPRLHPRDLDDDRADANPR